MHIDVNSNILEFIWVLIIYNQSYFNLYAKSNIAPGNISKIIVNGNVINPKNKIHNLSPSSKPL